MGTTARLTASVTGLAERGQRWAAAQDPATRRGVGTHWVRRYREADGQLYAVLLAAYVFLTVLPVGVVQAAYVSGNPAAFREMLTNLSHGAKIAMLGIPSEQIAIDWNQVVFNQLTIRGIYGREMYETWYKMTVMLQSGLDISGVITHRLNWRDYEQGFDAMRSGNSGKVILDWTDIS